MNTTTIEPPRITTLVAVRPPYPAVPSPQASTCRDPTNRELVLCAQGRGDHGSAGWERWLLAPLIAASVLAMVAATTTAGQWMAQWQLFVQWVARILA